MKKFLGIFSLLLLGFGCLPVANKSVDGKWQLAFDLPTGWSMVLPYDDTSVQPINENVTRNASEVWLQSSQEKLPVILPEGQTLISVSKMDSRRVLPKTLKDLGKGFFRDDEYCATIDPVEGQTCNAPYYLKTAGDNYLFQVDGDVSAAEKIIKSAKLVTHFTDEAAVKIEPTSGGTIKIEGSQE